MLEDEIDNARKEIITDGYDMSIGEIMNLYRDKELIINPAFQRLFRWDLPRKTKFVESIFLGIPIPPIFVFQNDKGTWELVDGLQRLSTIFELTGILDKMETPLILGRTKYLPSLEGKRWDASNSSAGDGIGKKLQIVLKRARMRVEILKEESDQSSKYELFQRLNTGGIPLTEQEVRNCTALMINPSFHEWINRLAQDSNFIRAINKTKRSIDEQNHVELALRFIVYRNKKHSGDFDVHSFLDDSLIELAKTFDTKFSKSEERVFCETFRIIYNSIGHGAFKKWDGTKFSGIFSISAFEVISMGVSYHLEDWSTLTPERQKNILTAKVKNIWNNETFTSNSGSGVRGSTRFNKLLPFAKEFFSVK
ncbi:MAG: DUF262 domain-containing protein [Magnetococcus sp. THC-1_WYH]